MARGIKNAYEKTYIKRKILFAIQTICAIVRFLDSQPTKKNMTNQFKTDKGDKLERAVNGTVLTLATCFLSLWDIVTRPLFDEIGDTPKRSIRATDTNQWISDYAPKSYRPVPNSEFIAMIERGLEGQDSKLVTVGSSNARRKVFAAFEFTTVPAFNAGGRVFEPYLAFLNSFDGSTNVVAVTGNRCGACDNQWSFISRSKGKLVSLRVRHTINSAPKIENISEVVASMAAVQAEFARVFDGFHGVKLTDSQARNILTGFVTPGTGKIDEVSTKTENKIEEMVSLFYNGKGNAGETLADLFSAVTDYYTHDSAGDDATPIRQFESSEFGTGAQRKNAAYDAFQDATDLQSLHDRGAEWFAGAASRAAQEV